MTEQVRHIQFGLPEGHLRVDPGRQVLPEGVIDYLPNEPDAALVRRGR